jgi:MoaA/NifB/PqqE/SkfB family radical SAM enzyme
MSLDKTFCTSPWFHMRINNHGAYEYCRGAEFATQWHARNDQENHISKKSPLEYFYNDMSHHRKMFLQGHMPDGCSECQVMDRNGKVSSRLRQLLKTGVQPINFVKTIKSSPFYSSLEYSELNHGQVNCKPIDLQIDLGNFCNSGCVFCAPDASSKLAKEFKILGLSDKNFQASWAENPEYLNKFLDDIVTIDNLTYMHFIGGEPLIIPTFVKILQRIVETGRSSGVTIGFTTNLTVGPEKFVDLFKNFKQVNIGMSIETFSSLNDYVRWPSKIDQVKSVLESWIDQAPLFNGIMQLRITPTVLTIHELPLVLDYAYQRDISVEACDFLERPEFMKISVLPKDLKQKVVEELENWVLDHQSHKKTDFSANTRDPARAKDVIVNEAQSYINYLKTEPDESHRWPDLIDYLKKLESLRNNSVIDYLPDEYKNIFRNQGY